MKEFNLNTGRTFIRKGKRIDLTDWQTYIAGRGATGATTKG